MRSTAILFAGCLGAWVLGCPSAHADATPGASAYPVAGLAPFERPVQAPRIAAPAAVDLKLALHGVSEPVPPSLKFLDHQGGWFNPFLRPGMTGPYDLRGWHDSPVRTEQMK